MRQAFSLVELSIVLVILGLLTGGILTGQNLIRAAELRSVTTEYSSFMTATHTFRDQYFALPGDMNNAQAFWPTATNGDGDGIFDLLTSAAGDADTAAENYGYWQQLALAGLIEGSYDGESGPGNGIDAIIGENVPSSKLGGAGWTAHWLTTQAITSTQYFAGEYGNIFYYGTKTGLNPTHNVALKPEEAWNLDIKVDDGSPARGTIRSREVYGVAIASDGCSNPAAAATAIEGTSVYDLNNSNVDCSLIFKIR